MHATLFWILNRRIAAIVLVATSAMAGLSGAWAAPAQPEKSSAGQIIKWVDEKGVTHYGDRLPPQYAGRDNSTISHQGVLLKRNLPVKPQGANADTEKEKTLDQKRRDHALLATYSSEQEIDLARDRNMQTDLVAVEGLQQNMAAAKTRYAANQKAAQDLIARKKPVPAALTLSTQSDQTEITKLEAQIAQRQASLDATRQRFDSEKQRFVELKSGESKPEADASASTTAKPAPTAKKP